jgi:hypothetical protein
VAICGDSLRFQATWSGLSAADYRRENSDLADGGAPPPALLRRFEAGFPRLAQIIEMFMKRST